MTVLRATYRERADKPPPSFTIDIDLADAGNWEKALESAHAATPEGCVMIHVKRLEDDDPRLAAEATEQ